MSATIISNQTGAKQVKNLGWLLRNWKYVREIGFNFTHNTGGNNSNLKDDGELWAKLKRGDEEITYLTNFASLSVCWNWLNRPIFKSVEFTLTYGENLDKKSYFLIGNDEWKEINQLEYKEFFKRVLTTKP